MFKGVTSANAQFLIYDGSYVRLQMIPLVRAYFEELLPWKLIAKKFGVGSKCVENSAAFLRSLFPEQMAAMHKAKLAQGKYGNTHGSRPPTPLIAKDVLEHDLRSGFGVVELVSKYGVSEFLLHRNIRWHALEPLLAEAGRLYCVRELNRDPELRSLIERLSPGLLDVLLRQPYSKRLLARFFRCYVDSFLALKKLQRVGKCLQKRASNGRGEFSFTLNWGELVVARELLSKQVYFIQQFPLGEFVYDFFLPDKKLVIEVDGSSHTRMGLKECLAKTKTVDRAGYKLLRLPFSDKGHFDYRLLHASL